VETKGGFLLNLVKLSDQLELPKGFRQTCEHLVGDWNSFENALNEAPAVSVRFNTRKNGTHNLPTESAVPWCENAVYLKSRPSFHSDPLFHAGNYYVQEASSMLLRAVLEQLPSEKSALKVLDLCAAPGGKSTVILDWLDGHGFLVANEVVSKRARVLEENLDKWGYCNRMVCHSDPKQFGKLSPIFDVILIDAPCSGEGMFRKDPGALEMWNPEMVSHCHLRQCRILEEASKCLKPGGYLIYSTCTYNETENEGSLEHLIKTGDFEPVSLDFPSEWNLISSANQRTGGIRCFPHKVQGEGFFISVLRRVGLVAEKKSSESKKKKKHNKPTEVQLPGNWVTGVESLAVLVHREEAFLVPKGLSEWIKELGRKVHVLSAGQKAGKIIRNELIPDHALAMSINLNSDSIQKIEMDNEEISDYLEKKPQRILNKPNGLYAIIHRKTVVGWAKLINGQLKNRFPAPIKVN
jgi:16S rRNA C967 or C1407 C5-methylase (RsmB/RsmF family)/NOL1/NOP2/fmu family ribosome biogenesis protein